MRTGYPRGLNKGLGSKLRDGSRMRQKDFRVLKEIPEVGRRARRQRRRTDNNKD